MPVTLSDYQEIVGPGVILELQALAERVRGRPMQHIGIQMLNKHRRLRIHHYGRRRRGR